MLENGGFVLENEPTGSGILVGFGCRDNYFAASRRTRFGKRTHREGVLGPRKRRFGENEPRLVCSENDMYAFEVELVRWKRSGVGVLGGGLGMQAVELAGETPAPLMPRRNLETGETPVLRSGLTEFGHGRDARATNAPTESGNGRDARSTLASGSGRLTSTSVLYNRAL